MNRRDFLRGGVLLGTSLAVTDSPVAAVQEQGRAKSLVIDAHVHAGRGHKYGKGDATTPPWETYNDPDVTLRRAEEAGIDQSVIFPIENRTFEKANEEIADIVKKYPGKFIGFAKHDPENEVGKIGNLLAREIKELGLKGLKLHKNPTPEVLETAADLKIPILWHPRRVSEFSAIAGAYPQINFIMAHLGNYGSMDLAEHHRAIDVARRHPNVYLETSSVLLVEWLERAARELSPEKLIFGSDGPDLDARVELYKIKLLKLPRDTEEKVLSGNILRLLQGR